MKSRWRVAVLGAVFALASLALSACSTLDDLNRHAVSSDSCYCFAGINRPNVPMIGHGWKI
jgi:hypothetical protein